MHEATNHGYNSVAQLDERLLVSLPVTLSSRALASDLHSLRVLVFVYPPIHVDRAHKSDLTKLVG